jgi:FkbM family methyltransferase
MEFLKRVQRYVRRRFSPTRVQFWMLSRRLGRLPRYQATNIEVLGYQVYLVDSASFLSMYRQIFVNQAHWFAAQDPSPLILDCGANIGLSVLNFKRMYPQARIIAFEPDPQMCDVLRRNVNVNQLADVEIVEAAVWTEQGVLGFVPDRADGGRVCTNSERHTTKVRCVRLRDYLDKPVDLLKLDVEGAETSVLLDCRDRLSNAKTIILEYHSFAGCEQGLDQLLAALREQGFRFYINQGQPWINPGHPVPLYQSLEQVLIVYAVPLSAVKYIR